MLSSFRRYFALLVTYLKPQWYKTVALAVCLLVSIGLDLLGPQILKNFIDTALAGGSSSALIIVKLFADRTAIVIAHRLATVQRVDDILIIEDGRVLEEGKREKLANDPASHFAVLLRTGLEEVIA